MYIIISNYLLVKIHKENYLNIIIMVYLVYEYDLHMIYLPCHII